MERPERDLRGDVVDGRFRVEEKLGSGGMGTVWRVQHVVSLQRFALKTLDPTYAHQEEATPRFLRAAGAAVPATDQWSLGLVGFRALAGVEYFAHVRGFPDLVLNIANDPLVP